MVDTTGLPAVGPARSRTAVAVTTALLVADRVRLKMDGVGTTGSRVAGRAWSKMGGAGITGSLVVVLLRTDEAGTTEVVSPSRSFDCHSAICVCMSICAYSPKSVSDLQRWSLSSSVRRAACGRLELVGAVGCG